MSRKIKWGLLAAGAIAKAFARGVKSSETGELFAVASRDGEKAKTFAEEFGVAKSFGSYEELLADPDVNAVYISTPHPMHTEWAIKAAEAGKHILCEKPIAINAYETMAIIEAADVNNVFLMEAYMYRCNPQTEKLLQLIKDGAIGDIKLIKATFSFGNGLGSQGRLWENALGGGGVLDVGGYTTSYACMVAGAALGKSCAVPQEIKAVGNLHPDSGVDAIASALLKFENGIIAQCGTGIALGQENIVQIFGSDGWIEMPNPYAAGRNEASEGAIILHKQGKGEPDSITVEAPVTSYAYEADICGKAILNGDTQAHPPAMTWEDTLNNLKVQDAWRQETGVVYDAEKIENMPSVTYAGRKLEHRQPLMQPGRVKHLEKDISRLIMGVDNQVTSPHAQAVFDHYFENGGNAFDTAFGYGEIKSRLVGQWLKSRGVRDDVVLVAKGAHTPNCNPEALSQQLVEQLEWFGTDCADIYIMHRDNTDIPVGEFMDTLNEHVQAGRIKAFGGSNWSLERVDAANAYAREKGLQEMTVVSNNLSLAVMEQPVWGGCVHVHDPASLKWLEERQISLLPWSSQARGFFLPGRAKPDKKDDKEMVRCWYSDDNFERQKRAFELADKYNVEPINIALAWVLSQPFPVFALIGPRTLSETRSSMRALDLSLTPEEVAYLDLR